jgi:WD40 repeat protein
MLSAGSGSPGRLPRYTFQVPEKPFLEITQGECPVEHKVVTHWINNDAGVFKSHLLARGSIESDGIVGGNEVSSVTAAYRRSGALLASACGEGRVAFWRPANRTCEATGRLAGSVTDLAWSPDDSLLAVAGEDGSLAVYSCP